MSVFRSCTCFYCHVQFQSARWRMFCCKHHYHMAWLRGTLPTDQEAMEARFWSLVEKGATTACWLWRGGKSLDGYGVFSIKNVQHRATHVAYTLATGEAVGDFLVMHRCDNPPCVNPVHLVRATQLENRRDAAEKGRTARGERHAQAKMHDAEVARIKRRFSLGARAADIAREFGIPYERSWRIGKGRAWRHVS